MARHETSVGDRLVWFDIARDADCECCAEVIHEGADAIYDEDGELLCRVCGNGHR